MSGKEFFSGSFWCDWFRAPIFHKVLTRSHLWFKFLVLEFYPLLFVASQSWCPPLLSLWSPSFYPQWFCCWIHHVLPLKVHVCWLLNSPNFIRDQDSNSMKMCPFLQQVSTCHFADDIRPRSPTLPFSMPQSHRPSRSSPQKLRCLPQVIPLLKIQLIGNMIIQLPRHRDFGGTLSRTQRPFPLGHHCRFCRLARGISTFARFVPETVVRMAQKGSSCGHGAWVHCLFGFYGIFQSSFVRMFVRSFHFQPSSYKVKQW